MDLGRVLKHGCRLGKEASIRREWSGGYESPMTVPKGSVRWRRGTLVSELGILSLTLHEYAAPPEGAVPQESVTCVCAQSQDSCRSLALILRGLHGSASAPEGYLPGVPKG